MRRRFHNQAIAIRRRPGQRFTGELSGAPRRRRPPFPSYQQPNTKPYYAR